MFYQLFTLIIYLNTALSKVCFFEMLWFYKVLTYIIPFVEKGLDFRLNTKVMKQRGKYSTVS